MHHNPRGNTINISEEHMHQVLECSLPVMSDSMRSEFLRESDRRRLMVPRGGAMRLSKRIRRIADRYIWNVAARSRNAAVCMDTRHVQGRRLVYLIPYDVFEPLSGGAVRVHELAMALGHDRSVEVVCLGGGSLPVRTKRLAPSVSITRVPAGQGFEQCVENMRARYGHAAPLLCAASQYELCHDLMFHMQAIRHRIDDVVLTGPYWLPLAQTVFKDCPVYYDAHDINRDFAGMICGMSGERKDQVVKQVEQYEDTLCQMAARIWCVSDHDRQRFAELYQGSSGKTVLIRNGVDFDRSLYVDMTVGHLLKERMGWDRPVALFIGAYHEPNLEAVDYICTTLAPVLPQVLFAVIGLNEASYAGWSEGDVPDNVQFMGKLTSLEKEAVYALADCALAPMSSGCGASLKIPDALVHGKPLLATEYAVRGYSDLLPFINIADFKDWPEILGGMVTCGGERRAALSAQSLEAYRRARETLDWSVIGEAARDSMAVDSFSEETR